MLTVIGKVDRTASIPFDSIKIEQVQGDPLGKLSFTLEDPGSQIQLKSQQEVIIFDENVALTPSFVVPAAFSDTYSTDTSSTASGYTSTNNPGGSAATWTQNLQSGGGTTGLTTYIANAASATIATADQLYTTAGTPTTVNTLVTCNGSTGWGEIVSQGSSSAWPALGAIGNPSGKGFFLDTTILDGQTIAAGNWSGNVRISANASGTITANLTVRVYRYRPSTTTYTLITSWTLNAQAWTTTINTVALPATAASAIAFTAGDKLYIDYWANITANTSGSGQQVRMNRLSTDTTGKTGDTNTQIVTPGYGTPVVAGNLTASGGSSALYLLNNWTAQYATLQATMTTSDYGGLAFNVVDTSDYYELAVSDASSPTPNTLQLYKTVAGVRSAIGSAASISFTRTTSHTVGITTVQSGTNLVITALFDGLQMITYTDTSPLGTGQVGLRNDTSGGASSSIYTAFSASSNDVPTLVKSVPAHNYLNNNDFVYAGGGWGVVGTIGTVTFPSSGTFGPGAKCTLSVSNAAIGNKQVAQNIPTGYIVIGQRYCLSGYQWITGAFTNADAWLQMIFIDANNNVIGVTKNTYTAQTTGYTRVSCTGTAPTGTVAIQISIGIETSVNGTNSGTIAWTGMQFEPMWFPDRYSYPTPICDFLQSDCITLPDGTTSRFDRVFAGFITHRKASYGGTTRYWEVECTGLDGMLENVTLVNASYTSVTDHDILRGIVNGLSPRYLFANDPTLPASAPLALAYRNIPVVVAGISIDNIQYADGTLREVINSLTDITGFLAGVDNYYNVYYFPPFTNIALYAFSDNPDNVTTFPYYDHEIDYDGTQLQNNINVAGGTYQPTVTESWNAQDGSHTETIVSGKTDIAVLFHSPVQVPTVVVGGSTLTCGLDTGTGFGTLQSLYNPNYPYISFLTPISAGTSISLTYPYDALVYANTQSPDSIGKYGRPFYGKINDTNLASNASATTRGEAELEAYSDDRITLTFKTWKMVSPGQIIEFTSALDGLSKAHFVVQKVTVTDLGYDRALGQVNQYEVQAGVYVDDFIDFFRNTQKAVNRASHDPAAPIQQYNNLQLDTLNITDSLNIRIGWKPRVFGGTVQY